MEIKPHRPQKKLHHHTVPILIFALMFLVFSIALLSQQNSTDSSGLALVHDLFTRPIEVKPTSNGFAHLTLNNDSNQHISPEVEQAGRTTELIFNLGQPLNQ